MAKYSKEFKAEAIRLSNEIGSKKAAAQLGIPYYTLADWRNNSKHPAREIVSLSPEELILRSRELERENMELREANDILKDALGFFRKRPEEVKSIERHIFILNNKGKYHVKTMCRVLKISESGYYRWLKNRAKPKARELLSVEIKAILNEHPDNDNYGVKRMLSALKKRGIKVSERTVYRTMSEMGILHRRRTPRGITKATTEIQDRENLIKRNFKADKPLQKLLSDITEIQCNDGKLYLSAVLDCYNGEILSIAMDNNMKKELCIRTVKELKMLYGNKLKGAIFHSDRGSQYTSEAFKLALDDAGLTQSLSGTGHCFDNARMESFFCYVKERKNLSHFSVQADTGAGKEYRFQVHIYLLQPNTHIFR